MSKTHIPTVLVVDDDENILEVLEARLLSSGLNPLLADRAETALEMLADAPVDCIVSDVKMPGMGGHGLLKEVLTNWAHIPIIMLTAHGTIPDAVGSVQAGAADYLTKPFDGKELVRRIRSIIEKSATKEVQSTPAKTAAPAAKGTTPIKAIGDRIYGGKAPTMKRFLELLERVGKATVSVLLLGESGTGKEGAARVLHDLSPRASGPFVVVDCGSTQPTLLESELFGHVKGSFTHALKAKKGLIEEADGGTLFLDEIGNISHEMQTRLLRFLQEGTIRPVGDTKEKTVSCRVVAATNASMMDKVKEGEFREDLYYRLKVVTLTIPPLRERRDDIPILVERFVDELANEQGMKNAQISQPAIDKLLAHPWPGNVRELKHTLQGALVFCQNNTIEPDDLQIDPVPEDSPVMTGSSLSLEENEKQAIIRALKASGGVKKTAADTLGISRRAIHYKIKKYGLDDGEE